MSEMIAELMGRFGLIAVFFGCVVEGETAALLAGFLAHQNLVDRTATFPAVFAGALVADVGMFLAGRRWTGHSFVQSLRKRPGFSHATRMARTHPNGFVFFNRFVYGMRVIGAVTAGISEIPFPRYVVISIASCAVWSVLFVGLGYFVGLSVEQFIGNELRAHEKLIAATALLAASALVFAMISRRTRDRRDPGSVE